MATKTVSLRLPEDMVDYLMKNYKSINQGVISELSCLLRIRQVSVGELRGLFSYNEWMFFADTFCSLVKDATFCCNKGAFIAACEDAERFDQTATKHLVDLAELVKKIETLRGANIEAIYNRIAEFWANSNDIKITDWAKF